MQDGSRGSTARTTVGWKSFRVLTVTTDSFRVESMKKALRHLHVPHSPGPSLFFFATREELAAADPLRLSWRDGAGREARLI
jgi:hypothetical protein